MKSMITVEHRGSFKRTERFMNRILRRNYLNILAEYGEIGVWLLKNNTPVDTGETAAAWEYLIEEGDGVVTISWINNHEDNGVNVAILLIYGHGLQNGAYVQGNDFVTPAMRPVFDRLANKVWKEVTK